MSTPHTASTSGQGGPEDARTDSNRAHGLGEFAEELRLLAEAVLERIEPLLRRGAAGGQAEWSSCSWCPVCAAAALVRGEHHDVVAAIADHGTAIVTVLREALAGVPVEPVLHDTDPGAPHNHSMRGPTRADESDDDRGQTSTGRAAGTPDASNARSRARYIDIPVTIKR